MTTSDLLIATCWWQPAIPRSTALPSRESAKGVATWS